MFLLQLQLTKKAESFDPAFSIESKQGVFVIIPAEVAEKIRSSYFFYPWDEKKSEWRLMSSWDTEEKDIEEFVSLLNKALKK